MIKLTRVYPRYYGGNETETLCVDEKSIICVGKKKVECSGLAGYYPYTEITLVTGDKYLVDETVERVTKLIKSQEEQK
jgi:hypothetical protein